MRRNNYQIPGMDLKNLVVVFPKQGHIFVLVCVCLKKFWKVIHKTENKRDPLEEGGVVRRQGKGEVFHHVLIYAGF